MYICTYVGRYIYIHIYTDIHIYIYVPIFTILPYVTIYILTNANLHNLNNNLLIFFCVGVVIKMTVLLSISNRDQMTM